MPAVSVCPCRARRPACQRCRRCNVGAVSARPGNRLGRASQTTANSAALSGESAMTCSPGNGWSIGLMLASSLHRFAGALAPRGALLRRLLPRRRFSRFRHGRTARQPGSEIGHRGLAGGSRGKIGVAPGGVSAIFARASGEFSNSPWLRSRRSSPSPSPGNGQARRCGEYRGAVERSMRVSSPSAAAVSTGEVGKARAVEQRAHLGGDLRRGLARRRRRTAGAGRWHRAVRRTAFDARRRGRQNARRRPEDRRDRRDCAGARTTGSAARRAAPTRARADRSCRRAAAAARAAAGAAGSRAACARRADWRAAGTAAAREGRSVCCAG